MTRPIDDRDARGGRSTDDITPIGDPLLDRLPDDTRIPDDERTVTPPSTPAVEREDPVAIEIAAVDGTAEAAGGPTAMPERPSTTSAEHTKEERSVARRRRRALIDWVIVIGVALLVAFLVRTFVLAHFVVDGTSMADTLSDGDRVFVNKLSYRLHDPNRGDVVVLHQSGETSERDLIKRVVGLPGETVEIRSCQVLINGQPLPEPYLDGAAREPATCGPDEPLTPVPEDHVYVLGDNRGGSQDSRNIDAIPEDELVGRAFVVFWPTSNWQWL